MPEAEQTRDVGKLATLHEPLRRQLFDHVRHSQAPVRREDAAAAVGISRTLAAYHLDKLADEGFLTTTFARREGRGGPGAGRPAKLYSAAASELAVSVPPRDYEFAARLLAEAAESAGSTPARGSLREIAARSGRELGRHADRGSVVDLLAERGYEPDVDEAGVIRLRNCPFHRLAADHRDLVCGMNQALLQGFLEGLERDDLRASLEPEAGHCCVAIRSRSA